MKEIILRSARCDVRMYIYFYAFLVILVKFGDAEVIEERRRELMFIYILVFVKMEILFNGIVLYWGMGTRYAFRCRIIVICLFVSCYVTYRPN